MIVAIESLRQIADTTDPGSGTIPFSASLAPGIRARARSVNATSETNFPR